MQSISHNYPKAISNTKLLDDFFYLLAGIDTSNVFVTDIVNCSCYDINIFKPFEFLIFKIREFYKVEEFDIFVQNYLKKLADLKTKIKTVEELWVALQEDIEIFKDLSYIKEKILSSNSLESKSNTLHHSSKILDYFKKKQTIELVEKINKWINQSDPTGLVSIDTLDGFSSCYWKNLFKIKPIDLRKSELQGIEECGKIIFLTRALFGIELVNDINDPNIQLKRKSNSYKNSKKLNRIIQKTDEEVSKTTESFIDNDTDCSLVFEDDPQVLQQSLLKNTSNDTFNTDKKISFTEASEDIHKWAVDTEQSMSSDTAQQRLKSLNIKSPKISDMGTDNIENDSSLSYFCYNGNISYWRSKLVKDFTSLTKHQLYLELSVLENIVFLQNGLEMMNVYSTYKDLLFNDTTCISKIDKYFKKSITQQVRKSLKDGYSSLDKCIKANIKKEEIVTLSTKTTIDSVNTIHNNISKKSIASMYYSFPSESNDYSISIIGEKQFNFNNFISITDCKFKLGDYILKLIKFQTEPVENNYLCNIQKIGLVINDCLLRTFISEKTTVEFNLIFRFLFYTNSVSMFIQEYLVDFNRHKTVNNLTGTSDDTLNRNLNFLRVIYLIFNKIRDTDLTIVKKYFFKTEILYESTESELYFDLINFTENFSKDVSSLLSKFYITDSNVFQHWSTLFDIAIEFIRLEYKEDLLAFEFNKRTETAVQGLLSTVIKGFGENDFTEFIKNLDLEQVL